jgi:hypothetical protein
MDQNLILGIVIFIIIFIIYLLIDLAISDLNTFLTKWIRKTLWIWLPFYALQRLIKEVIFKKLS